jgi:ribosome-associated GTPase EngA
MSLPIVAVVGRPNVGKSTFVNRIAGSQDAIVHESRGVTRDRSYHNADWNGKEFLLIDTGGIEEPGDDPFSQPIREQAIAAAEEADAIICIVDSQSGPVPEDDEVIRILRRSKTPLFLVVNKMDRPGDESGMWPFYSYGLENVYPVSAMHGYGTGDLLDDLVAALPEYEPEEEIDAINVAIIGRPNAGKSSLTNRMCGRERSIVSDVAGTTRDAIDTLVEHEGTTYRIIDTAGIRKKSKIDESIEYYGLVRSLRAIDRCDVALLMIDSSIGLTDQDQHVARLSLEKGCALVILLNKWDLLETPEEREAILERVADRMMYVGYAPVIRISALTGRSVHRIWDAIDAADANHSKKISTAKLNVFLTELREFGHTVSKGPKRLTMRYMTQTGVNPPEFTIFANNPELADDNFLRYIENRLRESFDFVGTPIRIKFRRNE